jgi:ATP-dependent Clp protease adaptor protein ClpS
MLNGIQINNITLKYYEDTDMYSLDFFSKWQINKTRLLASINNDPIYYYNGERPNFYNIYLVNNNKTPVSFYVFIIEEFFHQSKNNLIESFNQLRKNGYVCYGNFTKDVAESKISNIVSVSRSSNYSLKCIMSKDDNYVIKKS